MKIGGSGSIKPAAPASTHEVASGKQPTVQGPAASSRGDKVEITTLSAQLQQIEKMLSDVGVVDTARVEAIKLAISEGRFRVDSEVVADKLLTTVREYLATQKA